MKLHEKVWKPQEEQKKTGYTKNKIVKYYIEKPIKPLVLRRDHNIDKILTHAIKTKKENMYLGTKKK